MVKDLVAGAYACIGAERGVMMHFQESTERRAIVTYVYATVQYPRVSEVFPNSTQ